MNNMKGFKKASVPILLLAGLAAVLSNCIVEDRVVEVVLNDSTCASWHEYHQSYDYTNEMPLVFSSEIERILEDNGLSRADIVSAHIVRATYGVTEYSHSHDWEVTGLVTVSRLDASDGPAVLFNYEDLSVAGALGLNLPVVLQEGGVGVINRAFEDFIAGENPVLLFAVDNSAVVPAPSASDPIQFDWRVCIYVQVITALDAQVPDPF